MVLLTSSKQLNYTIKHCHKTMTEADATKRPLQMPVEFVPYLEKFRIYKLFKDMTKDLVLNLPKDHLKHLKMYLHRHLHSSNDAHRVIMLVSPELQFDVKKVVKEMIKGLGVIVITRRCIMDRYEMHDDYVPGCMSPVLMSEVTKMMTVKDPVPQVGWLMFDHPCTIREARCLQQDGVLPTVTLVLTPPPAPAAPPYDPLTPSRTFFQQDFEGLKYTYRATLKEVHIDTEDPEHISAKCFNAIAANAAGAQGPGQGYHALGAPGVYRVLLLGPRGSGRRTQAEQLAKHFGLVHLNFEDLYHEALGKNDDIAARLKKFGPITALKLEIVQRRTLLKDCVDLGWVMTGYPSCGIDFEMLDNTKISPNRIIFLNVSLNTCKARLCSRGVDWCTGRRVVSGSETTRFMHHPRDDEDQIDAELDYYYSEALAELRAAAGLTAVEINAADPLDKVQVKIQAAVIAAPAFDIKECSQLRNVRGD